MTEMSTLKLKVQKYRRFIDPQEIAFQDGLTIISGPNGVGKSTLVEAILFALFGTKRGSGISEIRSDKTRGNPHVECELLIDDQVVTIIRDGSAAEVAVNGVVQVMRGSSSGRAANECLAALLGGLTRAQFECSYIALQGDTAGLVEYKVRDRNLLIEKILQLEVLAKAVDMQIAHSEVAKSQVIAQGNMICNNELLLNKEAQVCIENFKNARVIQSRVQYTQSFQAHLEQAISDQQKKQHDVELLVLAVQAHLFTLQQQQSDHLLAMEKANKTYQQQEEKQKEHHDLQKNIAGVDGKLAQIEQDLRKLQDVLDQAEHCADASAEYIRLQKEKDNLEKRLERIPLVKKCYDDFMQAQRQLDALDGKLADLATVDEELYLTKEQENQCGKRRDTLYHNDPTAAEYETWQKQHRELEDEMEQNKQALEQLTSGTDSARCPTCNQHFTEHTPEHRIQHLKTWLNETWPPLHQELQQQKQHLDEQKKQWGLAKLEAEDECKQNSKKSYCR